MDILFPENFTCVFCGRILNKYSRYNLCEQCSGRLDFLEQPEITVEDFLSCSSSGADQKLSISAVSVFLYKGMARELVHKLKYNGKTEIAFTMAAYISEMVKRTGLKPDLIVPVPSYCKRIKQRGYNQAVLIAKRLSEIIEVPFADLLIKSKDTKSQVLLSGENRWYNVRNVFAAGSNVSADAIEGLCILVVDDIITTGATVYYCCAALKAAGAGKVSAASFART